MREKTKPEEDLGRKRPKAQTPIKKVSGGLDLLHSMVTAAHNMVPCMQKLLRKKTLTLSSHTHKTLRTVTSVTNPTVGTILQYRYQSLMLYPKANTVL